LQWSFLNWNVLRIQREIANNPHVALLIYGYSGRPYNGTVWRTAKLQSMCLRATTNAAYAFCSGICGFGGL